MNFSFANKAGTSGRVRELASESRTPLTAETEFSVEGFCARTELGVLNALSIMFAIQ